MSTNLLSTVHDMGTNALAHVESVASNVSTNKTINDAVVSILTGVKDAGSEIYTASKTAIASAVDFTVEQTPLVVKEFLHWKMAEAIIWCVIGIAIFSVLYWFNKRIQKARDAETKPNSDEHGICTGFMWGFKIIGILVLFFMLSGHVMTIIKIAVAPRVYLIEYVVDAVKDARSPNQR